MTLMEEEDSSTAPDTGQQYQEHSDLMQDMKRNNKLPIEERIRLAKINRQLQLQNYTNWSSDNRAGDTTGWDSTDNTGDTAGWDKSSEYKRPRISFHDDVYLIDAASKGALEDMKLQLQLGRDPNTCNHEGLTALHQCSIDGREDMAKLLLDHGASVNAVDRDGWTPLHAAATCGHLAIVKFMIEKGADLLAVNGDGDMPFDITEDEDTLQFIENSMSQQNITHEMVNKKREQLHDLLLDDINTLIELNQDLDSPVNADGATLLHVAVMNDFNDAVKLLLESGASDQVEDFEGWRPVHAAAYWGNKEAIELLVEKKQTDLSATTDLGLMASDMCDDPILRTSILHLSNQQNRQRLALEKETKGNSISSNSIDDDESWLSNEPIKIVTGNSTAESLQIADDETDTDVTYDIIKREIATPVILEDEMVEVSVLPGLTRVESISSGRNSLREAKKNAPNIRFSQINRRDSVESYDNSYDNMLFNPKKTQKKLVPLPEGKSIYLHKTINESSEESVSIRTGFDEAVKETRSSSSSSSSSEERNSHEKATNEAAAPIYAVVNKGKFSSSVIEGTDTKDDYKGNKTERFYEEIYHNEPIYSEAKGNSTCSFSSSVKHESPSTSTKQSATVASKVAEYNNTVYESVVDVVPSSIIPSEAAIREITGTVTPTSTATVFNDISYIQVNTEASKKEANQPKPSSQTNTIAASGSMEAVMGVKPRKKNKKPVTTTTGTVTLSSESEIPRLPSVSSLSSLSSDDESGKRRRPPPPLPSHPPPSYEASQKDSMTGVVEIHKEISSKKDRNQDPRAQSIKPSSSKYSSDVNSSSGSTGIQSASISADQSITAGDLSTSSSTGKVAVPSDITDVLEPQASTSVHSSVSTAQTPRASPKMKFEFLLDSNIFPVTGGDPKNKPKRGTLHDLKLQRQKSRESQLLLPSNEMATRDGEEVRTPAGAASVDTRSCFYGNNASNYRPPDSPTRIRHVFKEPEMVPDKSIITVNKRCSVM